MRDKVIKAVRDFSMLSDGEEVTVALSGGADSTALLLCLIDLGYRCSAVHVNHNLRGDESLRDENFCKDLCRRLGVPLTVKSVDVKSYCAEKRLSTELGARELRYAAFSEIPGKIATAHTLSDSVETAIFNLARGSGIKGLTGIPPVRGRFVRPLIYCTRGEIEEYLSCKGQDFVTDSTNLLPDCSRNIIRLNVIPELKKINPSLENAFIRTFAALRGADDLISRESQKILDSFNGKAYDFTGVDNGAIISGAITEFLRREKIEPSAEKVTEIKSLIGTSGRIELKKGIYIRADGEKLAVERPSPPPEPVGIVAGQNPFWDGTVNVTEISPFDISAFNKPALRYFIDKAKIGGVMTARPYRGSEKIALPNRGFSTEVKKLLTAFPPEERKRAVIIDVGGKAVLVEGTGVCEDLSCDKNTSCALRIDIIRREKNE